MRLSVFAVAAVLAVASAAVIEPQSKKQLAPKVIGPVSPDKDPRTALKEQVQNMRFSIDRELLYLARLDEVSRTKNAKGMAARQAAPVGPKFIDDGFKDRANDGLAPFAPARPGAFVASGRQMSMADVTDEPEPDMSVSPVPSPVTTMVPTVGPSMDPSMMPTMDPSMKPSMMPSMDPSMAPSAAPSVVPIPVTPEPTPTPMMPTPTPMMPTMEVSPTPMEPTPTMTMEPTPTMTMEPTPTMTMEPTPTPMEPTPTPMEETPIPEPSESAEPSMEVTPTPDSTLVPTPELEAVNTNNTSPTDDDSVCFPGSASVTMADGSVKPMRALALGDMVRVSADASSPVFMFTHKMASVRYPFVQLTTASNHKLSLTRGHYLYVNGRLAAASTVQVGDELELADRSTSRVVDVAERIDVGLYNPQTVQGDLVVDGVRVSTYTTAVAPKAAHAFLMPLRAAFDSFGFSLTAFDSGADRLAKVVPQGSLIL